jgi:WD40 repeat protein/tRNA A-37 threonylcarbamoyl transferase component Bud32/tetratricopeptide (TPR) repeat protein
MTHSRQSAERHALVDAKCEQFEVAWKSPPRLSIESLLQGVDAAVLSELVCELVVLERDLRLADGQKVSSEEYASRFPEFRDSINKAFAIHPRDASAGQTARFEQPTSIANQPTRESASDGNSKPSSGHLDIRCPSCGTPTSIAVDTISTDLTCRSCGSQFSLVDHATDTRALPPLSTLGRFELIERIGVGGFGSVWKARDKELDRSVAIKIPRQRGMSIDEQEKFFREARTAAQLRHPNIVSVHEVGRDGDTIYIVSAFVRGVTLSDWLTGQRLTNREAAELCAKIADALDHAHAQGVIHRDLKPANIIIDGDSQPHLMDFGLARREVGEVTVTLDGQVLGTPAYMSPEQAQGEAHTADRRSDVYSLGVVLFQLLTGELPFRGNVRMLIHQVLHDEVPSPRKLNSNISKDLETITLKCLEKEPARRYQSAADVAADLRRYLARIPIQGRPISRAERAVRWVRRNRVLSAFASTAVFALLVGTVVSTYFAINAGRQAALALEKQGEAIESKEKADVARHEAEATADRSRRQLYSTSMNLASQAWNKGSVPRLLATLATQMPTGDQSDLRSFPWRHFWRNSLPFATSSILRSDSAVNRVAYSFDGKLLACAVADGSVVIWRPEDNEYVRRIKTAVGPMGAVAFAGKSNMVAALGSDGTVYLWDSATGDLVGSTGRSSVKNTAMAMSPAGDRFATGDADGAVKLWGLDGKTLPISFEKLNQPVSEMAWSKDGQVLASSYQDYTVVAWDAASGKKLNQEPMSGGPDPGGLAVSPDGKWVAVGGYQRVHIHNTTTGKLLRTFPCHENNDVYALAWNPDGQSLASAGGDGAVSFHRMDNGDPIREVKSNTARIDTIAFSPDGQRLASGGADGSTILWDVPSENEFDALKIGNQQITALAFSPNGLTAASGNESGDLAIWDADKHTVVHRAAKAHGNAAIQDLAFLPDGKQLVSIGNGDLRIWDATTLSPVRTIRPDPPVAEGTIAVDAGGKLLAYRSGKKAIKVCHAETGEVIRTLEGHSDQIRQIRFLPKSHNLISVGGALPVGGEAILWNADTGERIATHLEHRASLRCADVSPDGQFVAVGLEVTEGTAEVLLCRAANLDVQARLMGSAESVESVAFSPDSRTVVAASSDGVIRFWGVDTHADEGELEGFTGPSRVAFNSAGTIAAVGRSSGVVNFLRATAPVTGSSSNGKITGFLLRPVEHWPLDTGSESAVLFYERLAAERTDTLGPDDPMTLEATMSLQAAYARRGVENWSKAYRKSLARLQSILGSEHRNVALATFNLGQVYADLQRPVLAVPCFEECLRVQRKQSGASRRETIATVEALAKCFELIGRRDDQLTMQAELLADKQALLGDDHAECEVAERKLIDGYVAAGKPERAAPLYRHRLLVDERHLGKDHESVAELMTSFAKQRQAAGDFKEAVDLLRQVVEQHPKDLQARVTLCEAYAAAKQNEDMQKLIADTLTGRDEEKLDFEELRSVGHMYFLLGNGSKAIDLLKQATADKDGENDQLWDHLAAAYDREGQHKEAADAWQHAVELAQKRKAEAAEIAELRHKLFAACLDAGLNDRALAALPPSVGKSYNDRVVFYPFIELATERKQPAVAKKLAANLVEWARSTLAKTPDQVMSALTSSTEQLNARSCWDAAEVVGQAAVAATDPLFDANHPQMHRARAALADATRRKSPDTVAQKTAVAALQSRADIQPTIEDLFEAVGQKRTIVLRVATAGGNNNVYINSLGDWHRKDCLTIQIAPETVKDFPAMGLKNPWQELPGKRIRVTGLLQLKDGTIQIRVTDAKTQLQIVEPDDTSAAKDET